MNNKIIFSSVVCLLLIISLLLGSCGIIIINRPDESSSCDTSTQDDSTSVVSSQITVRTDSFEKYVSPDYESRAMSELDSFRTMDLGSPSVFVTAAKETGNFFDEETSKVSSSVYKRNRAVEDKFGIFILTITESADVMLESMKKAKKSGNLYTDIAVIPQNRLGEFRAAGVLGNLRMLPFFDEDKPGTDKNATAELEFGDKLYGTFGNATKTPEKMNVVFINLTLAGELGSDISHSKMMDGGFTVEKMAEAAKLSRISLNSSDISDVYTSLYFAGGGKFTSDDKNLSLPENADVITSRISKLRSYFSTSFMTEESKNITDFNIFASGASLFAIAELDNITKLGSCGFMWDIFPLPKTDDRQPDYYTVMSFDAPVMTISTFTGNIDAMGYALNGINAASFGFIAQEYEKYLQDEFITSSKTLDSFDMIYLLEVRYDTAVMFRSVANIKAATEDALLNAVNSNSSLTSAAGKLKSKYSSALKSLR